MLRPESIFTAELADLANLAKLPFQVTSSHPQTGHGSGSWMEMQTQEAGCNQSLNAGLPLASHREQASTTTTAFDGLLRFAAGAMLGLALVASSAGPARADVEARAVPARGSSSWFPARISWHLQDVVIPVDDKGKTTTLTKAPRACGRRVRSGTGFLSGSLGAARARQASLQRSLRLVPRRRWYPHQSEAWQSSDELGAPATVKAWSG